MTWEEYKAMKNKDDKARPYYIAAIRHWDEGDEYVVIAFKVCRGKNISKKEKSKEE